MNVRAHLVLASPIILLSGCQALADGAEHVAKDVARGLGLPGAESPAPPLGEVVEASDSRRELRMFGPADVSQGSYPLLVVAQDLDERAATPGTGVSVESLRSLAARHGAAFTLIAQVDPAVDVKEQAAGLSQRVRELSKSRRVDPDRVYAVGYGSGVELAWRLTVDSPDTWSCVALVGGRDLGAAGAGDEFGSGNGPVSQVPVWLFRDGSDPADMEGRLRSAGVTVTNAASQRPGPMDATSADCMWKWVLVQRRSNPRAKRARALQYEDQAAAAYEKGDLAAAANFLQCGHDECPTAWGCNNLGVLRRDQQRAAEARLLFQEALRIDPHYQSARDNLAELDAK